ncbi:MULTISPECIES: hypothetical protein [unclassified Fusobacterium]|nr:MULTISPECIES: hypothetical protein [unclassified Fusobacterium]
MDVTTLEKTAEAMDLTTKEVRKCISRALNRTLTSTRAEQIRQTRENYTISATKLRNSINLFTSNSNNLKAKLISSGRPIGLDHFKLSPKKRLKRPRTLMIEVKKGELKSLPHSFIAYKDGKLGAFSRTGRFKTIPGKKGSIQREIIRRLYSASEPQMLGNTNIINYLQGYADEKFTERLEHELDRVIK